VAMVNMHAHKYEKKDNINMKKGSKGFKSGGLYEKHVVAAWNVGNHLSICL